MDDLISRQAAIDALDEYIEEYSYDLDENGYHNPKWCAMQEAKMTIQRLPSAERHGHWIENETSYADHPTKQTCNCSVCKKASTRPLGDWCRWCGAKMDEDCLEAITDD